MIIWRRHSAIILPAALSICLGLTMIVGACYWMSELSEEYRGYGNSSREGDDVRASVFTTGWIGKARISISSMFACKISEKPAFVPHYPVKGKSRPQPKKEKLEVEKTKLVEEPPKEAEELPKIVEEPQKVTEEPPKEVEVPEKIIPKPPIKVAMQSGKKIKPEKIRPQPDLASSRPFPVEEAGVPLWRRNSLPVLVKPGRPMIAVIIDDVGLDKKGTRAVIDELPGYVTISLMSYASNAQQQADDVRAHGHELMLHLPMQSIYTRMYPGPNALSDDLSDETIRQRIEINLSSFTGYVGINNHMGSRFTQNSRGMALVMEALQERGLLFIDSVTIGNTVGMSSAHLFHIPTAARDVFIDNEPSREQIDAILKQIENLASRKGNVIAIGHPHETTIKALKAWLPSLDGKGFQLVPVSAIIMARQATLPPLPKGE